MVHEFSCQNQGEYFIVFTIHIQCRPSVLGTSETAAEDEAMFKSRQWTVGTAPFHTMWHLIIYTLAYYSILSVLLVPLDGKEKLYRTLNYSLDTCTLPPIVLKRCLSLGVDTVYPKWRHCGVCQPPQANFILSKCRPPVSKQASRLKKIFLDTRRRSFLNISDFHIHNAFLINLFVGFISIVETQVRDFEFLLI